VVSSDHFEVPSFPDSLGDSDEPITQRSQENQRTTEGSAIAYYAFMSEMIVAGVLLILIIPWRNQ
jgi:hypothetical protein